MHRLAALTLVATLACSTDATDGDDTDVAETDGTETDGGDTDAADTQVAEDTDEEGAPNAKAEGTWSLVAAGSTCDMSFGGEWDGVAAEGNTLGFTLTLAAEGRTLACAFDAIDTSRFACGDVTTGGTIPPSCTVSVSVTAVSGTVSGDAASLTVTLQRTSPNCGQALNCGPSAHTASGTIAP